VSIAFGWVVGLGSEDEIGWNELSALVEELEEGVLGVGAWLSEKNGTGGVLDGLTSTSDIFSVGLHGELLQVGSEAVEVLIESACSN
jgi:hypothetical protein